MRTRWHWARHSGRMTRHAGKANRAPAAFGGVSSHHRTATLGKSWPGCPATVWAGDGALLESLTGPRARRDVLQAGRGRSPGRGGFGLGGERGPTNAGERAVLPASLRLGVRGCGPVRNPGPWPRAPELEAAGLEPPGGPLPGCFTVPVRGGGGVLPLPLVAALPSDPRLLLLSVFLPAARRGGA